MLCGAGVVFKLVQALLKEGKKNTKGKHHEIFNEIPSGWEKWLLDMVGIATLADMVPLQNENRTFARFGLTVLQKSRRKGLCTLLEKVKIEQKYLSEDDITFMIAPRINAAGRMDHPVRAFELLATDDPAEAESLADHLEHINQKRKGHVAAIIKDAKKKIKKRELSEVIVVGNPDWSPGILGLVASNLVEEFARPTFVWGYDNKGEIKGSCRGNGVSVIDLMRAAPDDTFLQFGGHDSACGFSIKHNNIYNLEQVLEDTYKNTEKEQDENMTWIDHTLSLDDVNWETYQVIEQLAPFGVGNEKPLFLFKNIEIAEVRLFGKEKNHLGLDFKNSSGKKVSAIGFFVDDKSFADVTIGVGEKIHLVATLEKSFFRNFAELRLRIIDIITV
jgi:single-stranded-DNA-specific exonuclease